MARTTIPLSDAPRWLEGLVIEVEDNDVIITIMKRSGSDYGFVRLDKRKLAKIISAL